ncbi:MAG: NAD(P)/FAD-dependent oxidoreductase, partial [Cytophagales bacterium]|nr:NAD(P)/FAD-dependent oxidoreductase [Cytophagales bacterium]
QATVSIQGSKIIQSGPLLITHWGFSGPAILRLSAWGARYLSDCSYKFDIKINWTTFSTEMAFESLVQAKKVLNAKKIATHP